jgi:hypothetical protein
LLLVTQPMRNQLAATTGFALLASLTACGSSAPGLAKDPPVITVTSPTRGSVQGASGMVTVTGTAVPSGGGGVVKSVTVNDTAATLNADGSFTAQVMVGVGATLLHTVATDDAGVTGEDVRAVQAGELKPVGSMIGKAVTASMSADSFTKLAADAGPVIMGLDIGKMIAPLQPMVNAGSSCVLEGQGFVDDVKLGGINVSLVPTAVGLMFSAELDHVSVPGHANFKVACISDSNTFTITADKVVVSGVLALTPNGMMGFTTKISNPDVELTNFNLAASGLSGDVINLLDLNALINSVVPTVAELAMNPLVNKAMGALQGPKQLSLLGQQMSVQVAPSAVACSDAGAQLTLDMQMAIAGGEASPGFIATTDGTPTLDPSNGFQIGLADNLANELLAELTATGMLNLSIPVPGGLVDSASIKMSMPPIVSADGQGALHLVLGDMMTTFIKAGKPAGEAAINATIDFQVTPGAGGQTVQVSLGKPEISINVVDDIPNTTGLTDDQLSDAVTAVLGSQIQSIQQLLAVVPLPSIDGISVENLSIGSDSGYVMVRGDLE